MPVILSGCRLVYIDPMARLFYDEKERFYREVKTIDLRKEKSFKNFADLDYYKNLPRVHRFDGKSNYQGTMFRFPFRDLPSRNPNPLSNNYFNLEKVNGLISAFKAEAAAMLVFLKNVNKITFEVLDGTAIIDSYVVVASQPYIDKCKQDRKTFIESIKNEVQKGTFSPHHLTYKLIIKEISKSQKEPKEYHYCLSEVFGYEYDGEFMRMVKDTDLAYVPLVGLAYKLNEPHSHGHIFCGLPLPLSKESLTGLPVHINGYFALGPDRKDLKWKSISTEKSDDKSVMWNEALLRNLAPVAYLNLVKSLIDLKLPSNQIYNAWPCSESVNPKWRIFLAEVYSRLIKERCIYSDAIQTWNLPSEVKYLRKEYFKEHSEFKVIYNYLMLVGYDFAVVPDNVFVDIQSPFVMERTIIQSLVANHIDIYSSFSKEEQNLLFSYLIRDQEDARKFLDRLPLRMAQGSPLKLTCYCTEKIYLPVHPYTKEFLPHYDGIINATFYSQENIQVLQAIGRAGMFSLIVSCNYFFQILDTNNLAGFLQERLTL